MTDTSQEEIERLANSVRYSQGITASNTILALLADRGRLERERDEARDNHLRAGAQALRAISERDDLLARIKELEAEVESYKSSLRAGPAAAIADRYGNQE